MDKQEQTGLNTELKIIEQVQKFSWNFDTFKTALQSHIDKYKNLVVVDENLQDMEKTQREIASLRIKLTKFKSKVKKELDKPYKTFSGQVEELLDLVFSAEKPLQDQLEIYENKRKEDKETKIQSFIDTKANELNIEEKYSKQIVIASKWLNRGQKWSDTENDILQMLARSLDQQQKDNDAINFRNEKIEMAKFMCESLSAGLATPLKFEDIENRIDSFDIAGLKTHIQQEVYRRKEREERAAQQAIERAEKERKQAEEKALREQQAQNERVRKQLERDSSEHKIINESSHLKHVEKLAEINKVEAVKEIIIEPEKLNAQIVLYGVTQQQIETVLQFINTQGIEHKVAVKKAV